MKLFNSILGSIFTLALTMPLSANAREVSAHSIFSFNSHGLTYNYDKNHLYTVSNYGSFQAGAEHVANDWFVHDKKAALLTWQPKHNIEHESHPIFTPSNAHEHESDFEHHFGGKDHDFDEHIFGEDHQGEHCVQPVPEPNTYLLMLAGLLLVFVMARQRKV